MHVEEIMDGRGGNHKHKETTNEADDHDCNTMDFWR